LVVQIYSSFLYAQQPSLNF